ncbi:PTS system mannose/fructose/sorbose family transporter subunit IID [Thermoanaerobacterium thermosaccharolyticum]|uniref:PTS system, mannose/fructose/sorbose family, IID component n=1 Tax=Thermoanaerobacterium thermosaccharolyticum M0795 TaxID=698948 RepID=L0IL82_THETR|nr:PTS system mannose/fructose/sorbose family transporter subunit IID [Thermoanaerobacterium thermosaccharolyticum]AGB19603.1 PTS system, mannose/fructose/sorbose family, IID component [Thermoanaerobacterium thermosaccharolyticum M0795]
MAYNSNDKKLSKKELYSMAWRSLFLQASFCYERMQAGGWLYSLLPALKKIYKDRKDDLKKAMKDHLEFFNTHPFLVTPILGIIAAMEEKGEDRDAIRGVKIALMGPLGGIGDAIAWLTILPICAGLGASLAIQGNAFGPILFLILFNVIHFALVFGGINYGYNTGLNALASLKTGTKTISSLASIVGLTVVGALIASYISMKTPLVIHAGKAKVALQTGVLDKILPNMLPLAFTFFIYWLLKKGLSPTKIIGIIILFSIVCKYFGVL